MMEKVSTRDLVRIDPAERVLLLPHCLRPSETCPGKYSKRGMVCPPDCTESCVIRTLKQAAIEKGYKGVCVAPGGSMVLRFVEEMAPLGIVAVACEKELEMGVRGVEALALDERIRMPTITIIPLSKDGCVDTEVDVALALDVLNS